MQTIQELRSMSETELNKAEVELKQKLLKSTYELKTNQSQNTSEPKKLKKDIARIKTIRRERKQIESIKKVEKKLKN